MPIKQKTPNSQIDAFLEERIKRLEKALLYRLFVIGEQVLNVARSTNSYKDQTGNLRSSIGYVVVQDGNIVRMSDFAVVKEGVEGQADGQEFARSLARRHNKGIVLIVVAGMNYAYYVKKRGYDVIDSSELQADVLVPKMLRQLGLKIK